MKKIVAIKMMGVIGVCFILSMCKKVNFPTQGERGEILSTPYIYSYIIVKPGEDTITLSIGNPFVEALGIDFALNNLNAIKGTIENDTLLYFVPEGRKDAFLGKIKATIKKINENKIEDAKDKIINDILPHAKAWVRGSGRYAVIRALEGAIRGLENPYGNFVYEPLGNSVLELIDYSYQIQINQIMKIRLPDGTYKIIEGDFVGKIVIVQPPIVQITGTQLNYLVNEYKNDPYWKEGFRILEEKGLLDTSVMKEVYCFASLSNEFYPPTIMGEYSEIVIIWPTYVDSNKVSDFVFATDGNISNAHISWGIPQFIPPDSITITNVEWITLPEGGGPIMRYYKPKQNMVKSSNSQEEEEIKGAIKAWCFYWFAKCIVISYIVECKGLHGWEYWDCVRQHINPCYGQAIETCIFWLIATKC